jgi:hypothetical protein
MSRAFPLVGVEGIVDRFAGVFHWALLAPCEDESERGEEREHEGENSFGFHR